jgi:hypothetical protein
MLNSLIGIIASSGGAPASTNSYESIATVSVGSGGSSSISFTSIPSTYQHLQVRLIAKDSRGVGNLSNLYMTFNSDTGANYATHQIYGDGGGAGAAASTSTTSMFFGYCASGTTIANMFGATVTDVLDYANTSKYKTIRSLTGGDNNGSGVVALTSGVWMNTGAISTITITPLVANLTQYSSFALYGIKG